MSKTLPEQEGHYFAEKGISVSYGTRVRLQHCKQPCARKHGK